MSEFRSQVSPAEEATDRIDWAVEATRQRRERGRIPRDWKRFPYGAMPGLVPFEESSLTLVELDELPDRIKQIEELQQNLSDIIRQAGIEALDQDGTNFCWINAVIQAMQSQRGFAGLPYVKLSPAMPGCLIKGYRNIGGWGSEGVEFIRANGVCSIEFWPPNAIKRGYDTPQMRENAKLHVIEEAIDLEPGNFRQFASAMIARLGAPAGYNYMSHEVYDTDLLYFGGRATSVSSYGVRYFNSWSPKWGDRGFGIIKGARLLPDDCCVVRVTTASVN